MTFFDFDELRETRWRPVIGEKDVSGIYELPEGHLWHDRGEVSEITHIERLVLIEPPSPEAKRAPLKNGFDYATADSLSRITVYWYYDGVQLKRGNKAVGLWVDGRNDLFIGEGRIVKVLFNVHVALIKGYRGLGYPHHCDQEVQSLV